jgi:hypothetical protein
MLSPGFTPMGKKQRDAIVERSQRARQAVRDSLRCSAPEALVWSSLAAAN